MAEDNWLVELREQQAERARIAEEKRILRSDPLKKLIEKLDFLDRWLKIQIEFREMRRKGFDLGYEYMGDLSQFWPFEVWYKVEIGEIQLYA